MISILKIVCIICIALVIPGVINRTRAILSGRKGVPFLQHLTNIKALLSKGAVYGYNTGLLFKIAPSISIAAVLATLPMIPFGGGEALISFQGDFVLVVYLLAVTRFITILGAMTTASSFEGMGSAREALYGALAEPALLITIGSLAIISGHTSFTEIYDTLATLSAEVVVAMVLVFYVLLKISITETGHVPVDDPRTHLELTMIHEVMILDYCGIDLALMTLSNWLKGGIFAVLAAGALSAPIAANAIVTILLALLQAVIIAFTESFAARNKLSKNATYIMSITALALITFAICFLIRSEVNITL